MKKRVIFTVILLNLILMSCVTMKPKNPELPRPEISYRNDHLEAILHFKNSYWAEIVIENKSDKVLTLLWDMASFTSNTDNSQRLIPEGTKYTDAKLNIPPITIAPGSKFRKAFAGADSFYYRFGEYGGWQDLPWLPADLKGSKFVFGYKLGTNEEFIVFNGDDSSKNMKPLPKVIGTVRYDKRFWNFLFINSPTKRRNELLTNARRIAEEKYGNDIELTNIEYRGRWNPSSLIMYFSMLGFVESASITADVISAGN